MTRHVAWQALLTVAGIVLVLVVIIQLVSSQTTIEVPVQGGTYVEGVLGSASVINPILASRTAQSNPVNQDLCALVFDGLTTIDTTGQVSPALAIDWDVSADGSEYEFRLRRDVTWHDGAPFTAADVVFTAQAIQDPDYQGDPALHELWRNLVAEKVDDYTVRFRLNEPFPSFLYYATIGILPAHLLGSAPAAQLASVEFSTRRPVGTGMFMVETVLPDRVTLVANPRYWGRRPFLERLEFWSFGDMDGLLASYQRGELQGFHLPEPLSLSEQADLPGLQLFTAAYGGYGAVLLNLKRETRPFFQTKEVRQSLLYALDRQKVIDTILGGLGLVADSPILPMSWAYDPTIRQYPADPERAMGLLDAAGWLDSDADRVRDKAGVRLAFELLTSDNPRMSRMAEELSRQWRTIGVEVQVRTVSSAELPELIQLRDFDAVLTEVGTSGDPDPYPLWHSTQATAPGQNFSGFADAEADLVMEQARATADLTQRAELYRTFQQVFAEQVPALLLYYPTYVYAVDSSVHNVQLSPLLQASDRFRNIADWYVTTSQITVSVAGELDKPEQ